MAPAVVFLLLLGVAGGRLSGAQALVNDAAVSGARAASLAPGPAEALPAAQTVIDADLQPPVAGSGSADCADFDPQTDVILTYGPPTNGGRDQPASFQAGGTVTVTVTCDFANSGLGLPIDNHGDRELDRPHRPVSERGHVSPTLRRLQRGSLTVFMVGAVFAMILAIGLGVDGSRALQGFLRASGEAQEAARTGADVLDVASVYGGGAPTVEWAEGACAAAAAYIEQTGDDLVSCARSAVDGAQLTVTVSAQRADHLPWALRCQQLHDEGLGHRRRPSRGHDHGCAATDRGCHHQPGRGGGPPPPHRRGAAHAGAPGGLAASPHAAQLEPDHLTFQTQGIDMGVVLRVLACVLWVLWAYLMVGMLVELVATLRGLQGRRRPWVAPGQRLAALLVGVVMLGIALMSRPAASTRPVSLSAALTPRTAVVAPYDPAPHPATTAPHASLLSSSPAPAADQDVQVQPGDSLWAIAGQEYGNPQEWPAIWGANQGQTEDNGETFTDPSLIDPGWELDGPDPAAPATATPPVETPASGSADASAAAPSPPALNAEQEVEVQSGDSLWAISGREYGNPQDWTRIWDADQGQTEDNGQTFTDPSLIDPGLEPPGTGARSDRHGPDSTSSAVRTHPGRPAGVRRRPARPRAALSRPLPRAGCAVGRFRRRTGVSPCHHGSPDR